MKPLELKLPPVFLFLACIALMVLFYSSDSVFIVSLPLPEVVFSLCFIFSGLFGLGGIYEFRKAKTSVHPVEVYRTTSVVESGIYRWSRNPMYFGLLLLLIGFGYWQQSLLSLLICGLFVMVINQLQIKPEERYLEKKFGEVYLNYKKRVRRWI